MPAPVIMIFELLAKVGYSMSQHPERSLSEKDNAVNDLICYCFRYSVDDINNDYLENGKSTIMKKIQMEKRFGNCQCATKNPKGK
jgi:hypothetical protein